MAVQYFPMVARLADGTFEPSLPGQGGTVVHVGTADPAEISEDNAGEQMIPGSRLEVGTDAPLVPGFFSLDDSHYLDWLADNGLRVPLFSPEGSARAAQAAQEGVADLSADVAEFIATGGRLHILGTLTDPEDLPSEPDQPEDAWLIDGDIWVHTSEDGWTNAGRIQGPKGDPGQGASNWDDLEDKPDVFPPAAHQHPAGDITGTLNTSQVPALPYRAQNWTPTAEQVQGLDALIDARLEARGGVYLLHEQNISGISTDPDEPNEGLVDLPIPTEMQGTFWRYVVQINGGISGGDDVNPILALVNGRFGGDHAEYRVTARATSETGQNLSSQNSSAHGWPRHGFLGRFNQGVMTVDLNTLTLGNVSTVSWTGKSWGNTGGSDGFLGHSGGRWSGPAQPLTHFSIRPATSNDRSWINRSTVQLWGYR